MVARLQHENPEHHDRAPVSRFGQLVTERVIVPRDEKYFFASAKRAFALYARRRSVLEFSFAGEEGTGVGPTAEFYTLVAEALQSGNMEMWVPDSGLSSAGLFPTLLPTDLNAQENVLDSFRFLGHVLARAFIDNRLVALHLSLSFCELLCGRELSVEDLVSADPGLCTLMDTKEEDVAALELTMVWAGRDLVPNGNAIDVTKENLVEFKVGLFLFLFEIRMKSHASWTMVSASNTCMPPLCNPKPTTQGR